MTRQPRYCIDTNSLMECRLRTYPPDVFPSVWSRMEELFESGTLISHEEVLRECTRRADEFAGWAKSRSRHFLPFDQEQEGVLIDILSNWELLLKSGNRQNGADPFLIALAVTSNTTLITEERMGSEKKPKIPNVCESYGVTTMTLLDLFREERFVF